MLQVAVAYYERCFDRLHCAKHPILGEAPHKPILLLTLIHMVETGTLKSKQIGLTPLLQQTFEQVWYRYVRTQHKMNLAQPFYHMQHEPFWNIQRKAMSDDNFFNKNKMKSLHSLQQQVDYATIDDELWACWQDKNSRENLAAFLIMRYFNKIQPQPEDNEPSKGAILDDQVLLIETAKNTSAICEVSVRLVQREFRLKLITKYQCCPLTHIEQLTFLIASHIKPWSESNDSEKLDINNGILLSVHLDKLFNLGEISFDDDGNLLCKTDEIMELIKNHFKLKQHNIKVGNEITNGLSTAMKEYLSHHRKKFHFDENSILFS